MTLRDFSRLSEIGKDEAILTKDDFITDKVIPHYKIAPYKINDFYVEVFFDIKEEKPRRYKGCIKSDPLNSVSV